MHWSSLFTGSANDGNDWEWKILENHVKKVKSREIFSHSMGVGGGIFMFFGFRNLEHFVFLNSKVQEGIICRVFS